LCPEETLSSLSCASWWRFVILSEAFLRSFSLTMLYRSNTALVLCPDILMATTSGIPARIIFLTAVLLRSWKSFPSIPAALQAVSQAARKSFIPLPSLKNTY